MTYEIQEHNGEMIWPKPKYLPIPCLERTLKSLTRIIAKGISERR